MVDLYPDNPFLNRRFSFIRTIDVKVPDGRNVGSQDGNGGLRRKTDQRAKQGFDPGDVPTLGYIGKTDQRAKHGFRSRRL